MRGMSGLEGRLSREHRTLECMTRIYCAHHHADRAGADLCPDCAELMRYARRRLEKCPYGASKPTCARCPIHCYKPAPRETVRGIMRFAGPRMTWRHPWLALVHVFDTLRRVRHPRELRDARVSRTGK